MLEEKDFADAAKKAASGDKTGAAAAVAATLATFVTGHPIVGAFTAGGIDLLARASVDTATKRLEAAERQWDSDQDKASALQESLVASLEPFFIENRAGLAGLSEQILEHFSQTLLFVLRNVASKDDQQETRHEVKRLLEEIRALRHTKARGVPEWVKDAAGHRTRGLLLEGRSKESGLRGAPEDYLDLGEVADAFGMPDATLSALSWGWVMDDLSEPDGAVLSAVCLVNVVIGARLPLAEIPRLFGKGVTKDGLVALGLHGREEREKVELCKRNAVEQASLHKHLVARSRTAGLSEKNRRALREQAANVAASAAAFYRSAGDEVNAIHWERAARSDG